MMRDDDHVLALVRYELRAQAPDEVVGRLDPLADRAILLAQEPPVQIERQDRDPPRSLRLGGSSCTAVGPGQPSLGTNEASSSACESM
jgi:hypothetical protein